MQDWQRDRWRRGQKGNYLLDYKAASLQLLPCHSEWLV